LFIRDAYLLVVLNAKYLQSVVPPAANLCNVQRLKLASLLHFGRSGVEEGSEGLEFS